jgi:ectoine hydroxylase-related dioxygenase (phytanoyl-CoA dioxygenase family)
MDPGDVLVFNSLIHHYTAANRSDQRRRALQFHYHQVGLECSDSHFGICMVIVGAFVGLWRFVRYGAV